MPRSKTTRRNALGTLGLLVGGTTASRASAQDNEGPRGVDGPQRLGVVGDAYTRPLTYNRSPTDDARALQNALDEAVDAGRGDLAVSGLGCSIASGLRYANSLGPVAGKPFSPMVAAPSATIDAMLAPSVWEEDANDFPGAAYQDKLNGRRYDIALDGNVANGATVTNGYVAIPYNLLEIGFKFRNISGTGYRWTHRNKEDDASVDGNLIINRIYGHSVENAIDAPMEYGYHFGADGNGKLTEGDPLCIHSYATRTAAYIGSAQGWMYMFGRHAVTDDGVLCRHANRTWFYGNVIDEFGHGYNRTQVAFTGIHLGSLTNTEGADLGLLGGTVLSRCTAGDTATYNYLGVSFQSNGDPGGKAVILADAHIHLKGSIAHTMGVVQISDSGNAAVAGTIHDLHVSGGYAKETVEAPLTLLSPYIKAHHVSHGKNLAWIGMNDRGQCTTNLDDLDELGGICNQRLRLDFSKAAIPTRTSSPFARIKLAAGTCLDVGVHIHAQHPNGYCSRGQSFVFAVQRHSSRAPPTAGVVKSIRDNGGLSNNTGQREISDIAVSTAIDENDVVISVELADGGSLAPFLADIMFRVECVGKGNLTFLEVE